MARSAGTSRVTDLDPAGQWEVEAAAWLEAKARYDAAKKEMDSFRPTLLGALEEQGTEDDSGHLLLNLTHPVGKWSGIQRQRRVTDTVDEPTALSILDERGLTDRCVRMVPQIDQDAIYAALYEGLLTEEDIYRMFPPKITYALVAVKA